MKYLLFALAGIALLTATAFMMTGTNQSVDSEVVIAYKQWKHEFNMKQSSEEEDTYRQSIFAENYYEMKQHNADASSTYEMGLNAFSALTQSEFAASYLTTILSTELPTEVFSPQIAPSEVASSINWATQGVLPGVKNQGQCGSCWAFSATGVLESTNVIYAHGDLTAFSEQYLVNCVPKKTYNCQGCSGGWPSGALEYTQANGIPTQAEVPYKGLKQTCKKTYTSAFQNTGVAAVEKTVEALQAALNVQPVSIAVDASKWNSYSKGVFNKCSALANKADHAVIAVGYNSDNQWIVRNSWGTSWGQAGYITLAEGNTCGLLNYATVATA